MKRILALIVAVLMTGGLLVGCTGKKNDETKVEGKDEKTIIKFWCHSNAP